MDKKIKECEIKPGRYQNTVSVVYDDGKEDDIFSYYNDELSFTASEFIGLTLDQALALFHRKDVAYLRS